jgi:ADP-ribose pyrophosphatase
LEKRIEIEMRFTNLLREEEGWATRSTTTQFADDHLAVVTALVQTPTNSEPRPWTIVHRKAAVVIAPQTSDEKFLLIKEERVPIQAAIWSMPAGQIDDKTEPNEKEIEAVALRELNEETGYELAPDGEIIPLGFFFTSPGFTDEHCYFFLARAVQPAAVHKREEGESILECRAFSAAELSAMIARNEIRDSNTLSICARMAARGLFSFAPPE